MFCAPLHFVFNNKTFFKKIVYSLIIIISVSSFLFFDSNFIIPNKYLNFLSHEYNYHFILNFDKKIELLVKKIREYDAQKTILVVENGFKYRPVNLSGEWRASTYKYFRHIEYYLPDYKLYEIFWNEPLRYFYLSNYSPLKINYSNKIKINADVDKMIIISDNIDQDFIKESLIQELSLDDNIKLFIIDFANKKEIRYYKYEFIKE
ncbi:MAG TPA: hypothetical protein PLF15_00665 [bacterium]|nr:hypothetical protein [bacterium]